MCYIWTVYKMALESVFRMCIAYCDQYLDWANLMQEASLEYMNLIKNVYR